MIDPATIKLPVIRDGEKLLMGFSGDFCHMRLAKTYAPDRHSYIRRTFTLQELTVCQEGADAFLQERLVEMRELLRTQ